MRTSVGRLAGLGYPPLRFGRRDAQPPGEHRGRVEPRWRRGVGGDHPPEKPLLSGRQPFLAGVEPAQNLVELRPCQGMYRQRVDLFAGGAQVLERIADDRPLDVPCYLSGHR